MPSEGQRRCSRGSFENESLNQLEIRIANAVKRNEGLRDRLYSLVQQLFTSYDVRPWEFSGN